MAGDDIFSDDWGFGQGPASAQSWSDDEAKDAERSFVRGVELHRDGKVDDAIAAYNEAVRIDPQHLQALNNLAVLLRTKGALDTAEAAYRRALILEPENPGFHFNLGNVLRDKGQYAEALQEIEATLRLDGGEAEYHAALGLTLRDLGHFKEALESLERAHKLKPKLRNLAVDWAYTHLLNADYRAGFAALWEWQHAISGSSRFADIPLWRGEPLNGRTLLLQAEPSDSDNILYIRYAPYAARLAKEKCKDPNDPGTVVLESLSGMTQLFSALDGVDIHLTRGAGGPAPDLRLPLMCLPGLFQTDQDSIPHKIPYLKPPAGRSFTLPSDDPKSLKIGLIWEGGGASRVGRLSNIALSELLSLTAHQGARFYSLQKGPPAVDLMRNLAGGLIHDLSPMIEDYLDMSRALATLDLVIAVDSGAAQLAGAMGLKVWLLADYACDWRWLRAGERTPWYPTARVFRQKQPGDWSSVLSKVEDSLTREIEQAVRQ